MVQRTDHTLSQRGFTLVELLAVMAIMGILAGVVAGAVVGLGSTGQATRLSGDRNTIAKSADRFFTDSFPQTYPVVSLDTNGDGVVDDLDDFDLPGNDLGVRVIDFDAILPQDATRSFVPDFLKEVPDSSALVSWRVDTASGNVFFAEDGSALVKPSLARLDVRAKNPEASTSGSSVQSDHRLTLTMRKGEAPINTIEMTIPAGYIIGGQQLPADTIVGSLEIVFDANNIWDTGNELVVTTVPVVVVSGNRAKAVVDYDANSGGTTENIDVKDTESGAGADLRTHTFTLVPPSGDKSPGALTLKFDRTTEGGAADFSDYEDSDVNEATETFILTLFDHAKVALGGSDVSPQVNVITNPKTKGVFRWLAEQNTAIDIEGIFDGLAGNQAVVIKTGTAAANVEPTPEPVVVFQDDFNAELILRNVAPLNTSLRSGNDLANWTITAGNVDMVGLDTNNVPFADNFPGNGTYLDMGGSVNGTIDSGPLSLSAGTYQLSFKIGNMGGLGNTLNVSLGLFSEPLSPTATSVLTQINRTIVVSTATTANLVFAEIGPDGPSGSALDDVVLEFLGP